MLLEDFVLPDGSPNWVAAAQQAALCNMVYYKNTAAMEAFLGADGSIVKWHPTEGSWLPSVAILQSGPHRYFGVSEGTIGILQALAQGPYNIPVVYPRAPDNHGSLGGLFYYQAYLSLADDLARYIPSSDPLTRVYFSGHSMGGAIAQVAGIEWARSFDPARVQLLTIAQPAFLCGSYTGPEPTVYLRIFCTPDYVPDYPTQGGSWSIPDPANIQNWFWGIPQWYQTGVPLNLGPDGTLGGGQTPGALQSHNATNIFPYCHKLPNYLGRIAGAINQYVGN